jgi:hypothetical protein
MVIKRRKRLMKKKIHLFVHFSKGSVEQQQQTISLFILISCRRLDKTKTDEKQK